MPGGGPFVESSGPVGAPCALPPAVPFTPFVTGPFVVADLFGNAAGAAGVFCAGAEEPAAPFVLAADGTAGCAAPLRLSGAERFVEILKISLPCTTRLSFDFFRSRVSISTLDCKHRISP